MVSPHTFVVAELSLPGFEKFAKRNLVKQICPVHPPPNTIFSTEPISGFVDTERCDELFAPTVIAVMSHLSGPTASGHTPST